MPVYCLAFYSPYKKLVFVPVAVCNAKAGAYSDHLVVVSDVQEPDK